MKIKKSTGEKVFDTLNVVVMVLFCLTIIFPFIQQIVISFSPPGEANAISLHLYPKKPTLDAYKRIFLGGAIYNAYFWTTIKTIIGTFLTVTITAMIAYPLSKKWFYGRKLWMGLVVFTMFFNGGLIPNFLLVRNLHMNNTIWSLIIPGLCTAWNIIIIRNFFMAMPEELEESATIDGANDIIIFFKIIIPLSTPVLATVTLWTMVGHWNAWFDAMIYITNGKIKVLQLLLRETLANANQMSGTDKTMVDVEMLGQEYTPESVKAAVLMLVITPIMCVYPFLQKYFVKGIMVGAVKG